MQLYISDEESSLERPVKELKGFKKVALAPGETKKVDQKSGESYTYSIIVKGYHPFREIP